MAVICRTQYSLQTAVTENTLQICQGALSVGPRFLGFFSFSFQTGITQCFSNSVFLAPLRGKNRANTVRFFHCTGNRNYSVQLGLLPSDGTGNRSPPTFSAS